MEAISRNYLKTKKAAQRTRGVAKRAPLPAGGMAQVLPVKGPTLTLTLTPNWMAQVLPAKGAVTLPLLESHQEAVRTKLAEIKAEKKRAAEAEERRLIEARVDKRLQNKEVRLCLHLKTLPLTPC